MPDAQIAPTKPEDVGALKAQRDELLAALKEARDGLRYWEPNTEHGVTENARINGLVELAIARAESQR